MTRHRALPLATLLLLALGVGAWLLVQPLASPFVAPSAERVQVFEVRAGEREISYRVLRPEEGWQTQVMQRLRQTGWQLARDRYAWGDTEDYVPTYTRVTQMWLVRVDERAQLLGSRDEALVKVERRLSIQWR